MSSLDLSGCKKRKREERTFRFQSFGEKGCPIEFDGSSFIENLKRLLECGQVEGSWGSGFPTWSFQMEISRQPPIYKLLWVVEEDVNALSGRYCKHCLYVGWGENLICNKKYHFLLPFKESNAKEVSLNYGDDDDADHYHPTRPMHGIIHSNGFGHLLCINGVELGSELPGFQIMDFWDRICTGLRARKVSLIDTSLKRGMELRLLHGLAYGEPWFGSWGYKFSRGSFGITPPMYKKAIETLQGIPLLLLTNLSDTIISDHEIPMILSRYQSFSNHSLVTLGDIFHFMSQLEKRIPKDNININIDPISTSGGLPGASCRWSSKRVEMATRVIVDALKKVRYRWISRQEVRDAARAYIGDTGLLDFVLKSLGNHIVGNFLVRRCLNPVTKVLEYSLEDMSKLHPSQDLNIARPSSITRGQVMKDMACLYKFIFGQTCNPNVNNNNNNNTVLAMKRVVLDSKHFIKEYNLEIPSEAEGKVGLFCTVSWKGSSSAHPPYECFMLQENTTVDDLKFKVEATFQELYWGMKGFAAESVVNINGKGADLVLGKVHAGTELIVEGRLGPEMAGEGIYEGSMAMKSKIVECACGAIVDDGERMVTCDICEVWQHTRCVGIPDDEPVPSIFLCKICEARILLSPSLL
ncbi:hypothetical protein SAY87_000993 [Trapa incisa]|uniref:Zinc finger PHD-type domain-containing protein n=1 Tax=Trapa incisa TaxID=236973 RepID=A0AAN7GUM3_9MYRT|nr:hypothetical protein SAY87_000993 [Trapa incisa]